VQAEAAVLCDILVVVRRPVEDATSGLSCVRLRARQDFDLVVHIRGQQTIGLVDDLLHEHETFVVAGVPWRWDLASDRCTEFNQAEPTFDEIVNEIRDVARNDAVAIPVLHVHGYVARMKQHRPHQVLRLQKLHGFVAQSKNRSVRVVHELTQDAVQLRTNFLDTGFYAATRLHVEVQQMHTHTTSKYKCIKTQSRKHKC